MSQNITLWCIVCFDNGVSCIFGQIVDGNALPMFELNGITTGNRTIGCATVTNIGVSIRCIDKCYGEREELIEVSAIAGNGFTDCQTANFAGICERSDLDLV